MNSIRVKAVCERHCNNGWMSRLETQTKPILSQLIVGNSTTLSEAEQRILAQWIAVKVVVAEHARRELAATAAEDRKQIMDGFVDPERWQIWVGKHSSSTMFAGGYCRQAFTLGAVNPTTGIPEPHDNVLIKNTQAVTLGIGDLLIYAIYSRVPTLGKPQLTGDLGRAMVRICPTAKAVEWPGSVVLDSQKIRELIAAFDRFAAKMPWLDTEESS